MRRALFATLAALAAVLSSAVPAQAAATLGFRWAGVVRVYDGTGDARWKVAEAAREWSARTSLRMETTSDPAAAQIVVTEADFPAGHAALGAAFYPPSSDGVAYGQCRVELATWLPAESLRTAEHTTLHELGHCVGLSHNDAGRAVMATAIGLGEGYTKPQAADWRNLRTLYP